MKMKLIALPLAATLGLAGAAAVAVADQPNASGDQGQMCGGPGMGWGWTGGRARRRRVRARRGHDGDSLPVRPPSRDPPDRGADSRRRSNHNRSGRSGRHGATAGARARDVCTPQGRRPINTHDPLFAALFKNADKIDVEDRTHPARIDGHRDLEGRERDQTHSPARRGGGPVHRQRNARNDAEPLSPRRMTHVPARDLQGLREPSFRGCGRHVEQVLADVALADRCECGTSGRRRRVRQLRDGLVDWMADLSSRERTVSHEGDPRIGR